MNEGIFTMLARRGMRTICIFLERSLCAHVLRSLSSFPINVNLLVANRLLGAESSDEPMFLLSSSGDEDDFYDTNPEPEPLSYKCLDSSSSDSGRSRMAQSQETFEDDATDPEPEPLPYKHLDGSSCDSDRSQMAQSQETFEDDATDPEPEPLPYKHLDGSSCDSDRSQMAQSQETFEDDATAAVTTAALGSAAAAGSIGGIFGRRKVAFAPKTIPIQPPASGSRPSSAVAPDVTKWKEPQPSMREGLEALGDECFFDETKGDSDNEQEGQKGKRSVMFKAAGIAVIGALGFYTLAKSAGKDDDLTDNPDPAAYQGDPNSSANAKSSTEAAQ